ncbi:unnamed protein product [Larinioides sclopetarius]|uniref:Uncharacterized protein n=1 Tax=Larinioides sclopetarius TaxID=280406 RepID=A0AAV2AXP9_9ARAC
MLSVQKFSNTDCSICFIACQAEGDYLYDVDGEKFKKKEIVEKFIRKE